MWTDITIWRNNTITEQQQINTRGFCVCEVHWAWHIAWDVSVIALLSGAVSAVLDFTVQRVLQQNPVCVGAQWVVFPWGNSPHHQAQSMSSVCFTEIVAVFFQDCELFSEPSVSCAVPASAPVHPRVPLQVAELQRSSPCGDNFPRSPLLFLWKVCLGPQCHKSSQGHLGLALGTLRGSPWHPPAPGMADVVTKGSCSGKTNSSAAAWKGEPFAEQCEPEMGSDLWFWCVFLNLIIK